MAATNLPKMLEHEEVASFLLPGLQTILEVYLQLMHEIDSEELVGALEEVVKYFKDDVGPYAY